jgi:predicted nucleic-acid-binding protein
MPALRFDSVSVVQRFVRASRTCRTDLADLLIAESARQSGCDSVLTFDKKAAKLPLFQLLKS